MERASSPGSEARHDNGGAWRPAGVDQQISPTIVIRRPQKAGDVSEQLLSGSFRQISRQQAEDLLRVDPDDLAAVLKFVQDYGLNVVAENAEARTVQVEGSAMRVGHAFGVDIEWRVDPEGQRYLSYQGELSVPASLAGVVEAVLGLDQRPV